MVQNPLQHCRHKEHPGCLMAVSQIDPIPRVETLLDDKGIAGIETSKDAE